MTIDELAGCIDLTLLRPDATKRDIAGLITNALSYPFASVFIPPAYVRLASRLLKGSPVRVGTAVGFPLGCHNAAMKILEAKEAFDSGAREIDMVMNISAFKSGDVAIVEEEISAVRLAVPEAVLKVIIETCYLNDEEKITVCEIVVKGGTDFVKTSTGFGPAGATVEDVRLLVKIASGRIKVKAAGGIRTLEDTLRMLDAGADRIGTSLALEIVEKFNVRPFWRSLVTPPTTLQVA